MRTFLWFVGFICSTIGAYFKLGKVKELEKAGKEEEKERYIHEVTSNWMRTQIKRSGATITVHGEENIPQNEAVVYISNHQGNFDIPILMSYINQPKGFIAKIEIKKLPVIRTWMTLIHCVFMDRSTLKGSAGAIMEGIKILKQGHSLVIFPEGTRSKGDQMGEFKAASFKLATKPGIPIVPVTINGSYKLMEAHGGKIKPDHVELTIHPPIITKGLTKEEQAELPEKVQAIIASALPPHA